MIRLLRDLFVLLSLAVVTPVLAADKAPGNQAGKAAFERMKALSGEWVITAGPKGHGHDGGTITYKVTAGGSAVLETIFGGSDHEMVTLYYLDGDDLVLTHYCVLQNRPVMRAEPSSDPKQIVFRCQAGDNAAIAKEVHMHEATFTFVDADHYKSEWVLYRDGKPDSTHPFELTRKGK